MALATVLATRRSAPRPVGSKLAVSEQGELAGSVSGGCVESEVAVAARDVLARGEPTVLTYGITDEQAGSVGLPCGGEIDVGIERVALSELDRLSEESAPNRLVVFGAVDIAEALCRGAKELGWDTIVADPRATFATRERIASADELLVEWPEQVLERIAVDEKTAVVVLTHEERFDVPALAGALRSDAFYVGAIGSRRTQEHRRERLLEEGLSQGDLNRLSGPTGLDLGAETPAETAVSILAEIIAVRAGRSGGRLRDASSRIHVELQPR
jgi:xanthine dehydrogenase accessory factor